MAIATALRLTTIAFLIAAVTSQTPPTVYTNHTVGDKAGWFFDSATNTSSANYSSWASTQTFNLGDYLIFNTSSNQSVIQTYDPITFANCSTDDASDNDTFQYDGGNSAFSEAMIIPVPLTHEGVNYFFSDAYDGIQCQNGMAFEIRVNRGLGLPPNLNQPPPPPYREPPGPDFGPPAPNTQNQGNGGTNVGVNLQALASGLFLAVVGILAS